MSSDRVADNGQNARLLRALVWGGVGLAPIAALTALIGGDGPVRFGVLVIAVCVVLVGASLLVRHDPVLVGMQVEDRVAEEVNALREELRAEFAAAARASAPPPRPAGPPPRPAGPPRAAAAPRPAGAPARPAPPMAAGPPRQPGARTGRVVAGGAGSVPARGGAAVGVDDGYDVADDPGYAPPARGGRAVVPGSPAVPGYGPAGGEDDVDGTGEEFAGESPVVPGYAPVRGGRAVVAVSPAAPGYEYDESFEDDAVGYPPMGEAPDPSLYEPAEPAYAPAEPGYAPAEPAYVAAEPAYAPPAHGSAVPASAAPAPHAPAVPAPHAPAARTPHGPATHASHTPVAPAPHGTVVPGHGPAAPGYAPAGGPATYGPGAAGYAPAGGRAPGAGGVRPAARRVASAPGWPDVDQSPRPRQGGRPGPRPPAGMPGRPGAVPGPRGRGAASVSPPPPTPAAPVFRPPAAAEAGQQGATYGAPRAPGRPGGARPQPAQRPGYAAPADPLEMPGNFEDSGEVVPAAGLTTGDQGGRRRADVTAVDLGYTGRRAKPDPQEEPAEEQADDAEYYSSNGNYWEASYSEAPTGYPGWAEADERHGDRSWRGREDTGGW